MSIGAAPPPPRVRLPRRIRFTSRPTPILQADRLARALGKPAGTVLIKRDDLTELSLGGNKVRKLEYVVAEALARRCDYLVTAGAVQSNSARATAAAAAVCGLSAHLVLNGEEPDQVSGNLVLDALHGATVSYCRTDSDAETQERLAAVADELRSRGHRPFVVPVGASTPLGSLGYVRAADELRRQAPHADLVVVACGSAGTHAGLVAGFGRHDLVLGVRVNPRPDLAERVERLALDTAQLAGRRAPVGQCRLDDDHLGGGYGVHTAQAQDAIQLVARTEGVVLDPVYTGKAMSALVSACLTGRIPADRQVVFLHSGGAPGLLSSRHGNACGAAAARTAPGMWR